MEDLWLMIRIFLVVIAWGGLLLLAGFGLEMLSRTFSRDRGGVGAAPIQDDTSGTPASS